MNVITRIRQKARQLGKTVVLPESEDERVLRAARDATSQHIASVILVGERETITCKAGDLSVDLSDIEIIEPENDPRREEYIEELYRLRKNKGMDREKANEWLHNPMYYACMMLRQGAVDGVVAGAVLSSSNVIRPALQIIKTAQGIKLASSCFLMLLPEHSSGEEKVFLFADCGFNPQPKPEELAHIAVTTARTAQLLIGIEGKVAMLSFSTKGSATHEAVDRVVEATRIAKKLKPELLIDGELQADAALVPEIGRLKAPESEVAGKANVLIFPDLNSGNISYKIAERLAGATAIGPILQGLAKPVNDVSRGCKSEDIINQIAVTALQTEF